MVTEREAHVPGQAAVRPGRAPQPSFGLRAARLRFGSAVTGAITGPNIDGQGASWDWIVTVSPKPLKRVDIVAP